MQAARGGPARGCSVTFRVARVQRAIVLYPGRPDSRFSPPLPPSPPSQPSLRGSRRHGRARRSRSASRRSELYVDIPRACVARRREKRRCRHAPISILNGAGASSRGNVGNVSFAIRGRCARARPRSLGARNRRRSRFISRAYPLSRYPMIAPSSRHADRTARS